MRPVNVRGLGTRWLGSTLTFGDFGVDVGGIVAALYRATERFIDGLELQYGQISIIRSGVQVGIETAVTRPDSFQTNTDGIIWPSLGRQ